ncbi:hypothetical protein J3458_020141 [Metarhizium acridum]|uniref:uncharacterized protein n=1 Tax=Metarhizium acridum TaxID=92637 RepID=UPI001C6C7528|nr:hypothetical protein J3458_020141 [Metarhizium acridum]
MFSGALSIVVLVAFMATRPCPGWWHLRTPGRLIMTVMKLRTRDETIADTARSLRSAQSARCQMQVVDRRRKASFQYRCVAQQVQAINHKPECHQGRVEFLDNIGRLNMAKVTGISNH